MRYASAGGVAGAGVGSYEPRGKRLGGAHETEAPGATPRALTLTHNIQIEISLKFHLTLSGTFHAWGVFLPGRPNGLPEELADCGPPSF